MRSLRHVEGVVGYSLETEEFKYSFAIMEHFADITYMFPCKLLPK